MVDDLEAIDAVTSAEAQLCFLALLVSEKMEDMDDDLGTIQQLVERVMWKDFPGSGEKRDLDEVRALEVIVVSKANVQIRHEAPLR